MQYICKKVLTCLFILLATLLYSNKLYFDKLSNESPSDFVLKSERLLNEANSEEDRLHIIYYTGRAWYKLKEDKKAIANLLILEKRLHAFEKKNPVISTKLYGEAAYLYTYLKYAFKAKGLLDDSNRISMFLSNKENFHEARAYFYFYTAKINSVNGEDDYSMQNYKKADDQYRILHSIKPSKNLRLGHSIAVNLGDVYMVKGDLKNALKYNHIALQRFDDGKFSGVAYMNIGMIHSRLNQKDSALVYYKKSIEPLKSEGNIEYLNESFDSIKSIFLAKNNVKMAKYYSETQVKFLQKLEKIDNIAINRANNYSSNEKKENFLKLALTVMSVLLIILIFRKIRNEKKIISLEKIIEASSQDLDSKTKLFSECQEEESSEDASIDNAYHKKILEQLTEYENTVFFIDPDITMSKVAVHLNISPQTLSRVINKNKDMNFSTYITTLRIEYIICQLSENPQYKSYKIAYLATLCGFASHSTFTKAFKNIKGISPSEYLEQLYAEGED
ncbi:MAG: Helix-turn-helix domain protein [Chryseobacterium sp.]|jgi:AraC-like DNA-binding protein|nr:Helix-turn-helix domain protein [Chryseobacterium sp.]